MLVLFNNRAGQGRGSRQTANVVAMLRRQLGEFSLCAYDPPFDLRSVITDELQNTYPKIICLGGDGTINYVVNAIMDATSGQAQHVALGAVGVGSSNDALKPITNQILGMSARINTEVVEPIDLGRVTYTTPSRVRIQRHFIANSGLGVIAEANARFNTGGVTLDLAKRVSVHLAIVIAALSTIVKWRSIPVDLTIDGHHRNEVLMDALSIVKIPWIAGGYHYDLPTGRNDGTLGVHLTEGVGRLGLLDLMRDLSNGNFRGKDGRSSQPASTVAITSRTPISIEFDGEVEACIAAEYTVVKGALQWMT